MKKALTREEMRDTETNVMPSYFKIITKGTDFRYRNNKKVHYFWYRVEKPCPKYPLFLAKINTEFGRDIEIVINDNRFGELSMDIYFRGYAKELG